MAAVFLKLVVTSSVLASVSPVQQYSSAPAQFADVVNELARTFHASCVFLVTSDTHACLHVKSVKHVLSLATQATFVSVKVFKEKVLEFRCRGNRPLFVLSADSETRGMLQQVGRVPCYGRWVLFMDQDTSLQNFLQDVNVPFDCEFLTVEDRGSGLELSEVYQLEDRLPLTRSYYGVWRNRAGLNKVQGYLYQRRNLEGITLKACVRQALPVVTLTKNEKNEVEIEGFFGDMWKVLEERANFTTTKLRVENESYGEKKKANNTWTGMITRVINKTVHFCVGDFDLNSERMGVVDYLSPLLTIRAHMVIKSPDKLNHQWNSILKPFSTSLWFGVIACILVLGMTLNMTHNIGQSCGVDTFDPGVKFGLNDALLCVYGFFCQQGPEVVPRACSCRCLYIVAGAVSIVVVAVYSAVLTSFMTVQDIQLPFIDLEGFLKDGSYKINTTAILAKNIFKHSNSQGGKEVYVKHIQPYLDDPAALAKENVKWLCAKDKRVYVIFDIYLVKAQCAVTVLPQNLAENQVSMILTKNSPYRRILNYHIQKIRTSGVMHRLKLIAWPKQLLDPMNNFPEVTIEQAKPIFGVAAIGAVLGVFALVVERGVRRWTLRRVSI